MAGAEVRMSASAGGSGGMLSLIVVGIRDPVVVDC
jgi:hypothetical protein